MAIKKGEDSRMGVTRRGVLIGTSLSSIAMLGGCAGAADGIRIGFVVKMPEVQWFQDEWAFAGRAAHALGFDLLRIGGEDGDRVLAALGTLYARYAQGLVICAPDPRLGPAIAGFGARTGMKILSVDDRLTGPRGAPIASIPHVGISAVAIGATAGEAALAEAKRRGWSLDTLGVLRIAHDSLETGRDRTMGAVRALVAGGVPQARIFDAPQRTTDTEGAFTAAAPVLTRSGGVTNWIILGLNDETVVGGVRAAEGLRLGARQVIGVGIGGSQAAIAELERPHPTGFLASVLLSARRHGYDTSAAMYRWITQGLRPPAETLTPGILIDRGNFRAVLAREAA
ncbi:arabinose ABC transporter substrate-binding protein [Sphingomonas japonica]|nr:arabinose ABC transporter substrate-binding protein [Sphingomonas japonica]